MKKIYLLSAVACMFALTANAQDEPNEWTFEGVMSKQELPANVWFTSGQNATQPKFVEMEVSGTTQKLKIKDVVQVTVKDSGDPWSTQFCQVFDKGTDGCVPGAIFQMEFDLYWSGPFAESAPFNMLTGKLLNDTEGELTHDNWQWDAGANKEFDFGENFWGIHNAGYSVNKEEWKHIVWPAEPTKLGDAGCLGLQINLAAASTNIGKFFFANMKLTFGKEVYEMWNTPAEGGEQTAINDAAAIKAFVANDVLYASEAADVVIYNINGVAVKSAKNAASVNVSDLKAGLYIAKVGNATVKFVK
jgi:hypothetical protein